MSTLHRRQCGHCSLCDADGWVEAWLSSTPTAGLLAQCEILVLLPPATSHRGAYISASWLVWLQVSMVSRCCRPASTPRCSGGRGGGGRMQQRTPAAAASGTAPRCVYLNLLPGWFGSNSRWSQAVANLL